jgi:hypothetical protein
MWDDDGVANPGLKFHVLPTASDSLGTTGEVIKIFWIF